MSSFKCNICDGKKLREVIPLGNDFFFYICIDCIEKYQKVCWEQYELDQFYQQKIYEQEIRNEEIRRKEIRRKEIRNEEIRRKEILLEEENRIKQFNDCLNLIYLYLTKSISEECCNFVLSDNPVKQNSPESYVEDVSSKSIPVDQNSDLIQGGYVIPFI
jgi:hypothetical protein